MLCQYKDIFGRPYEGIHSTRIPYIDLAFWDVFGTIILIILFSNISQISILNSFLIITILFIFIHALFCVETSLNTKLKNIIVDIPN